MKNLILLTTVLFASIASANWAKIPAADYKVLPPPSANSTAEQNDFESLLEWQKNRTKEQCDAARAQLWAEFEVMFGPSDLLTEKELQKYAKFFNKVENYASKISSHYKEEFLRERPYDKDSRVQPCIKKPGGRKAYPSGHATAAAASACVLATVLPAKAEEIVAYGDYLGELRVIAGVHHPSDIEAGQDLGRQICKRLLNEPDFRKGLDNL